jgi:hypothetical protein
MHPGDLAHGIGSLLSRVAASLLDVVAVLPGDLPEAPEPELFEQPPMASTTVSAVAITVRGGSFIDISFCLATAV